MTTSTRPSLDALLTNLKDLWKALDELLDSIQGKAWQTRHGKHWVYADVPYHLSYFDRDVVAIPLERGLNVPKSEQKPKKTDGDLNAWNEEKFRQRPTTQTVEQSLRDMRASREFICQVIARLNDADLTRPAYMSLPGGGWVSNQVLLDSCYMHTWAHFVELRARMKKATPVLSAEQTRRGIRMLAGFMPIFLDRAAMQEVGNFTFVMNFTGAGGVPFTVNIKDGKPHLSERFDPQAELVMTMEPETIIKMRSGIIKAPLAMLTGKIKVKGMGKMATFGKLFHPPRPDQELPYNPDPSAVLAQ